MAFFDLLAHSAVIQQMSTSRIPDRFGQPVLSEDDSAWEDVDTVACRWMNSSGRERMTEQSRDTITPEHKLYFMPEVGDWLNEHHRVKTVRDVDGSVLAQHLDILYIKKVGQGGRGTHHLEVTAQEFKG